jgi:hypothetical protein
MVCDPGQNNINIPQPGPGPSIPGLGAPFSIPKVPFPDLALPEGIPEDIIDLIERIFALFPQGIQFVPNADSFMKGVWDALASIFNQIAPFLSFYKFIQAALELILCIIDVLCSLFSPWATVRAIKRLFKRCLPNFLSLFPWIALLVMILALILLLIALIEYVISVIIAYIDEIIENIKTLERAIQVGDEASILAAVNKLAYLLCLIEQLFAIFLAFSALLAVIRPLMEIAGRGVCARGSSSCCAEDFCPEFLTSPDGQVSLSGRLIYQNRISQIIPEDPVFNFLRTTNLPALRNERWQFVDDNPMTFEFKEIITPSPEFGFIYWPEPEVYNKNSTLIRVPYLLDMKIFINPADFGNPSDVGGEREMFIQDIIVSQKPTISPVAWNNGVDSSIDTGALDLVGGKVFEITADGYTPYFMSGSQATLENLINRPAEFSDDLPITDDGYNFFDVEYHFRYNYEVLIDKKLVNIMCQPDLRAESDTLNAEFVDISSVIERMGDLPNVGTLAPDRKGGTGALGCLASSLTKFRENLNPTTAEQFKTEATECLNNLKAEAEDFYCRGVVVASDRFNTEAELSPDLQFVDNVIDLKVTLRDKTGTQLAVNITDDLAECIAKSIKADVTLGEASDFEYDGYGSFTSEISSDKAGIGEAKVLLSGESLAFVEGRDDDDVQSSIIERVFGYEFIDSTSVKYGDNSDTIADRFGPPDIAEDGA